MSQYDTEKIYRLNIACDIVICLRGTGNVLWKEKEKLLPPFCSLSI